MSKRQGYFTQQGCAAPLGILESKWPGIVDLQIQEQSRCADIICVRQATDMTFCEQQLQRIPEVTKEMCYEMNSTSVGNMAYLSLHACIEHRQAFARIYDAIMLHMKPLATPTTASEAQKSTKRQ